MDNLEKSWKLKIVISRPGKVGDIFLITKVMKSHGEVMEKVMERSWNPLISLCVNPEDNINMSQC